MCSTQIKFMLHSSKSIPNITFVSNDSVYILKKSISFILCLENNSEVFCNLTLSLTKSHLKTFLHPSAWV